MEKVLLIDDELRVIQAIEKGVRWERCGIDEVFLCNNAQDARELMISRQIDLVISDIEMPGMNGLEFVRWLKSYDERIVVMLLTAYSEFEYAREAVSLGVQDYILKPVVYPELEEKIVQSLEKVEKTRRQAKIENVYEKNKGHFIGRYVRFLLQSEEELSQEKMEGAMEQFQVDLRPDLRYVMIWLSIKDYMEISWEKQEQIRELLEKAFEKSTEEIWVTNFADTKLLATLAFPSECAWKIDCIREKMVEVLNSYQQNVCCYMSDFVAVSQMRQVLLKMKKKDAGNVIFRNHIYLIGNRNVLSLENEGDVDYNRWFLLLEEGRIGDLKIQMDLDLHGVVINDQMNAESLRIIYNAFMQMIYRCIGDHYKNYQWLMKDSGLLDRQQKATNSVEDFREFYHILLDGIENINKAGNDNDIIERVQIYIEKHLEDKISREEIAEYVALNESYLSRLFRKNTGQSISDYIVMRKISKAKQLLIQTNLPVTDIACTLGYDTCAYFIKVFKKSVGKTPKEYRREIRI